MESIKSGGENNVKAEFMRLGPDYFDFLTRMKDRGTDHSLFSKVLHLITSVCLEKSRADPRWGLRGFENNSHFDNHPENSYAIELSKMLDFFEEAKLLIDEEDSFRVEMLASWGKPLELDPKIFVKPD